MDEKLEAKVIIISDGLIYVSLGGPPESDMMYVLDGAIRALNISGTGNETGVRYIPGKDIGRVLERFSLMWEQYIAHVKNVEKRKSEIIQLLKEYDNIVSVRED